MAPLITFLLGAALVGYLWHNARGLFWLLFWLLFGIPTIIVLALAAADNDSLYILVKGFIVEMIPVIFHELIVEPLEALFDWLKDLIG